MIAYVSLSAIRNSYFWLIQSSAGFREVFFYLSSYYCPLHLTKGRWILINRVILLSLFFSLHKCNFRSLKKKTNRWVTYTWNRFLFFFCSNNFNCDELKSIEAKKEKKRKDQLVDDGLGLGCVQKNYYNFVFRNLFEVTRRHSQMSASGQTKKLEWK